VSAPIPADSPTGGPAALRRYVMIAGRRFPIPSSRRVRMGAGLALVGGGMLGFLPVLGFWMLPLGVVLLSVDISIIRRWRRRIDVRFGRWRARRRESRQD
jgi:hypothetical protein